MRNPEGNAVSDGNRVALLLGCCTPPSGRNNVHNLKTNGAEWNTHLIQQDVVPDHDPRTKVGSLLERWYAGSCLRQVTQEAAKKEKREKKREKNLLFFSVLLQNIKSRM